MGFFDRKNQNPGPAPPLISESKYTLDKVEALLDKIGPMRLSVSDPALKIMITQITWGVLPYLSAKSSGTPTAGEIAEVMTDLDLIAKTLQGYVTIQNSPQASPEDLLRGYRAIETYANKISDVHSNVAATKISYNALTDYLTGN